MGVFSFIKYTFYKCLVDTVRKEAATIMAVFPSPNDVMSILVQVFARKPHFVSA